MSITKILNRSVFFSIVFFFLKLVINILLLIVGKNEIDINIVISDNISLDNVYFIFLTVFLPLFISSIIYLYFDTNLIKIVYWLISLIPICLFVYGSNVVTFEFTYINGYLYLLLPLFLIFAFYYNFKIINNCKSKFNSN